MSHSTYNHLTLNHRYTVVTAPTVEPITLADAKTHCRVIHDDDNAYITDLITLARQTIEHQTNRAIAAQTMRLNLDKFPVYDRFIELRRPPITAVSSVQYVDESGNTQTFATSKWWADTAGEPGRVVLAEDQEWPDTDERPNAVTITFTAGYSVMPAAAKHLCRLIVGHFYENREPVVTGTIATTIPHTLRALMDQLRWGAY